jgi:uncharacterized membrane protein YwzB
METTTLLIAIVLGLSSAYFIEDYLANKHAPARPKSLGNMGIIFLVVFGLVYVALTYFDDASDSMMKNVDVGEPDW